MKHFFIVGVKGSAMSNLAVILKEQGNIVAGCDVEEEFITDPVLKQYGIPVISGFDPLQLPSGTDTVVYSAAHQGEANPVVVAAKQKGIRCVSQAVLLGELLDTFSRRLAVAGCHGKTTTSSLLAYSLMKLKADPSYLVGVPFFNRLPGGQYKGNTYFVIEADEYGVNPPSDKTPKLLHLHPSHIICTNIDYDHPDVYKDLEETKKTFLRFFEGRNLYLCRDDENLSSVIPKIKNATIKTYGFLKGADMQISQVTYGSTESSFKLDFMGKDLGTFTVRLFGEKNILNATGVILLLCDLGFSADSIRSAIADFSSVKRRNELVYTDGDTYLFDDYGHHPSEITATIDAARKRYPGKRIVVLFQPHTYSRTLSLKDEFVQSLSKADISLIAPIFASAREKMDTTSITSSDLELLAKKADIGTVHAYDSKKALLAGLTTFLHKGDVVFTVGAGDIYKLKDDIIGIISRYTD